METKYRINETEVNKATFHNRLKIAYCKQFNVILCNTRSLMYQGILHVLDNGAGILLDGDVFQIEYEDAKQTS